MNYSPKSSKVKKTRKRTTAIERHTIITLSTGHLPESLATPSDGCDVSDMDVIALMTGEYGWLVNVDKEIPKGIVEAHASTSITDALKEILWWAKRRGAQYVLFDSDGPCIERFAIYDW